MAESQPADNRESVGAIQVDDASDADSSYGDDPESERVSTASLYSEITRHVYENGRRYHSYRRGTYWYVSALQLPFRALVMQTPP
jgi:hypothetical protein